MMYNKTSSGFFDPILINWYALMIEVARYRLAKLTAAQPLSELARHTVLEVAQREADYWACRDRLGIPRGAQL